jgi:antitoxin (DNA-binding transcriptional repressor) of toxin-antitoxin stability system
MVTFEADEHLEPLLERAEAREEVVITRHGEPIARNVWWAEHPTSDEQTCRDAREGLRLDPPSIKALIEDGRE